jgi:hypothetical protein
MTGIGSADPGELWAAAIREGDFAAAHRIADAVMARRRDRRDDPSLPYHLRWVWDGRPFDGRRVVVRCYHGLGDTLQFARYLPALAARAAEVTLEAPASVLPLLAHMPVRLQEFDVAAPIAPGECDIEIMELAHALRAGPMPEAVPYLHAPPGPPAQGPRIGLCWQAGDWDAERSVPLHQLLPAVRAAHHGAELVSLQRGPAAAEAGEDFINPGDTSLDLARTAELIAGCKLTITVDTMVAHLAGALGARGVVLLKATPDWRWTGPPWYPTLRPLYQRVSGDWQTPLRKL